MPLTLAPIIIISLISLIIRDNEEALGAVQS
jgi:hypothetical protein